MSPSKRCGKCQQIKPLTSFYGCWNAKDGRQYRCSECYRGRDRKRECKDLRWRRLTCTLSSHRLTLDQYHALCESQDWQCAICFKDFDGKEHVDHSHATGRVRGILCLACNTAIGKLKENVDVMQRAIDFVSRRGLTPREKSYYVLTRRKSGDCPDNADVSATGPDSCQELHHFNGI